MTNQMPLVLCQLGTGNPPAPQQTTERLNVNYSIYQTAIFEAVKTSAKSIIVNAVAGSGKTTTIIELLRLLSGKVAFVAFSTLIASELKKRLGNGADMVCTTHAMGRAAIVRALGRVKVMGGGRDKWGKSQPCKIMDYILANNPLFDNPQGYANKKAVKRLLSIIRNTLANYQDAESLSLLMAQYDIRFLKIASSESEDGRKVDITDKLLANVPAWMDESISMGMRGMIDFDDMLYLPAIGKFECPKYDVLLIDEVQDYNAAQIALTKASVAPNGRIIAVGDRRQAIFGFRGASANAFDILKEMFGAIELPLSISYRCPKSHVRLASALVPEIEHAENAEEGEVITYTSDKLADSLPDKALVIARRNAPLVPHALKLIKAGRKAIVKGKRVADNLIWLIKNMEASTVSQLIEKTEAWKTAELAKWTKKPDIQDTIIDKAEIILALCEACATVNEVLSRLDSLFSDGEAAITFSTIHRAKGLEAEYVAILESGKLAQASEALEELNCTYVAYTRSKRTLAMVS